MKLVHEARSAVAISRTFGDFRRLISRLSPRCISIRSLVAGRLLSDFLRLTLLAATSFPQGGRDKAPVTNWACREYSAVKLM